MRKLLFLFVFLIVLVVGAAFVALQFVLTPEFIRDQLQQAVKSNTGRDLVIGQEPRLSYWPKLSVDLRDVSLSNPPDMQSGIFAKMEKMRVQVDVPALFSRRLQIEEISLESPEIQLLVNDSGNQNWALETSSNADADVPRDQDGGNPAISNPIEEIALAPLTVTNGRIQYSDERNKSSFSADDVDMTITLPDLAGALKTEGSLVWNGRPLSMTLFVEQPQEIAESSSIIAMVIESELLEANFTGELTLRDGFQLIGEVDSSSPSVKELAAWTGNPLEIDRGLGSFYAQSGLSINEKSISLPRGKFGLDGMNAAGEMAIDISGNKPFISGNLTVDKIDVNTYLPPVDNAAGDAQSGANSGSVTTGWSDEPIDLSGLKAVNARLSLATSAIFFRDVAIGKTQVQASLQDGRLDATLNEMAFYDGSAKGRILLSGKGNVPSITGRLNANGLDGNRLLKDFAKFERISGRTSLALELEASGKSQRQLVSTLDGVLALKFEDGALRGINIPQMVRSVQSNILGGWQSSPEEKTDFSVLQADFDIRNGVASNDNLLLASPLVRVTGDGLLNMVEQSIDYRVAPKVVGTLIGQGGSNELNGLKVPVIIRGPWTNPKIYPDIKGILENPQAAFDALSKLTSGGIDLDIAEETKQIEEKVSEEIGNAIQKAVPKEAEELLGDTLNDTLTEQGGNLLKGLLGGSE
ncbi:MAG: AsmA family protein [Pseudomonadota bacterium]